MELASDNYSNTNKAQLKQQLKLSLKEQVSSDVSDALSKFNDEKKGLKILASKMEVHEKTLKRILNKENTPGYLTLLKIYRVLLDNPNDQEVVNNAPEIVKAEIKKHNPQPYIGKNSYSINVDRELLNNPVFAELYILCATAPVSHSLIEYRFGSYGLQVLEKMLLTKVLQKASKDYYVLGQNQATFNAETIKRVGIDFVEKFSEPANTDDKDENYLSFYAEGLSEQAYKEWLKIDEEAFYKKVEVTKKEGALGDIRAFTFMSTDKITGKKK